MPFNKEMSDLVFQVKVLKDRLDSFENGRKYTQLKEKHSRELSQRDRTIKSLRKNLKDARSQIAYNRTRYKEYMIRDKEKAEQKLNEVKDEMYQYKHQLADASKEIARLKAELADKDNQIALLKSRLNKDYTNSSKPSSQSPDHKTIPNGRKKSGKRPGGQQGHEHHPRKLHKPTKVVAVPVPEKYLNAELYKPTGRMISKQVIGMRVITETTEYQTPEFRNIITGQRVHAPFPDGLKDDVTYDGSVKAIAYLLNNDLYVSIDKTRTFLKEISGGEIDLSNGLICSLSKQFSEKTAEERNQIFSNLQQSSHMHADYTFGRVNGSQFTVLICTNGEDILYQRKDKKGYEGIKDSPLADYEGTVVSDHEKALCVQGRNHQECLSHVARYAIGAEENEPKLTWTEMMEKWITEAIHYWDEVHRGMPEDTEYAEKMKQQFAEITDLAEKEYKKNPPTRYYPDGKNLAKRLKDKPEDYLLFLNDLTVPPTNNEAEICARKVKRKSHQVMAFRSQEAVGYFCDGLSVIQSIRKEEGNLFAKVCEIFERSIA
jgi:hypothetical protein